MAREIMKFNYPLLISGDCYDKREKISLPNLIVYDRHNGLKYLNCRNTLTEFERAMIQGVLVRNNFNSLLEMEIFQEGNYHYLYFFDFPPQKIEGNGRLANLILHIIDELVNMKQEEILKNNPL